MFRKGVLAAIVFSRVLLCAETMDEIVQENPSRVFFGPEFMCIDPQLSIGEIDVSGARFFWGFRAGYEYLKKNAFYGAIDILATSTDVDFKAKEDGQAVNFQAADRTFGNIEVRLGYTFAPPDWMVTTYAAVGMYNLYASDHHQDEGIEETLPYAGVGLQSLCAVGNRLSVGVNTEVFYTFASTFSFTTGSSKIKDHRRVPGIQFGVPFDWRIGKWDILIEPYYLRIAFSQGENVYGTKVSFGYRF